MANPKAHFSFSRGRSVAPKAATLAVWNREFLRSAPQPFHARSPSASVNGAVPVHWPMPDGSAPASEEPCFDERNVASVRRSEGDSPAACAFMVPAVMTERMRSTVTEASTARAGARVSPDLS